VPEHDVAGCAQDSSNNIGPVAVIYVPEATVPLLGVPANGASLPLRCEKRLVFFKADSV
jgi:hypothetical protein